MNLLFTLLALAMTWGFDDGKAGKPPTGFEFGAAEEGATGKWILREEPGTKGLVLSQEDETDDRYTVAVAKGTAFKDVRLRAKIKTRAGGYQAAGVVWRLKDPNNYYVARINPDEENINLYMFKGGKRHKLAGVSSKVLKPATWHTLLVEQKGPAIVVKVDGKTIIEHKDETFATPGKVGLWVKDDTVARFDDFQVEALK